MRPKSSEPSFLSFARWTGHSSERSDAGFALVGTLWLVLMLGIVAGIMLVEARSGRRQAAEDMSLLKARLLADAGINRAIASLSNPQDPERWPLDGTPRVIRLFDMDIEVSVESESGKIDLNEAPTSTLAALFRTKGIAPAEAEQLADRVVSWRRPIKPDLPDDEADAYRAERRFYAPRHAPFLSIEELRLVVGMSDKLQRAIAPLITVYSRTPDIDRQVASNAVLDILGEMGDRLAVTQRSARDLGQASGINRALAMGEAVMIRAQGVDGELKMVRTAVLRLTGDRREPFWVLTWR